MFVVVRVTFFSRIVKKIFYQNLDWFYITNFSSLKEFASYFAFFFSFSHQRITRQVKVLGDDCYQPCVRTNLKFDTNVQVSKILNASRQICVVENPKDYTNNIFQWQIFEILTVWHHCNKCNELNFRIQIQNSPCFIKFYLALYWIHFWLLHNFKSNFLNEIFKSLKNKPKGIGPNLSLLVLKLKVGPIIRPWILILGVVSRIPSTWNWKTSSMSPMILPFKSILMAW